MSTIRANAILDNAGGNTATINGITPALASQAQAEAGTDNATLMTPLRLRNALNATGTAPIYACRAWVNFNGTGTVAIRASGNVSSITDNGVGDYTVNFTTAMPDANYVTVVTPQRNSAGTLVGGVKNPSTPTSSAVTVTTLSLGGVGEDALICNVAIFR